MNPLGSTRINSRIVVDMLKLIYDPYMIGAYFSNQNFRAKTDLVLEYVLELKKLADVERGGLEPDSKIHEMPDYTLEEL